VTNPKVSIFFLAFLLATLLVFGGVAIAAGKLGAWLRQRPGVQRGMNRMAALVLLALAVGLLASRALGK
jgi:threonine/homoserine/homoserine lactone efflux protein